MTRWRVGRTRLMRAVERMMDDLDVPEELYTQFCVGLFKVLLELEEIRLTPQPKRSKATIIPFKANHDE